jgi:hypothetical protein
VRILLQTLEHLGRIHILRAMNIAADEYSEKQLSDSLDVQTKRM